jgi:branched-chain amino acid transport system substrate-binding protein
MRFFNGLLSGLALLLCALLCASPAWSQAKPPVRIAAVNPLSGAGAFDGQLALEGMQAMVAIINAQGGVLGGRMLELITYDDKGSPEEGVSAAKRAIEQDKVDLLVGGWFSAVALGQKEVTRDKIIHVVTSSQHPKVTEEGHKWLFRLNATSNMMSERYSKFICEHIKPKSVAFITISDDYGRLEYENYARLLGACGIQIKGNEYYNRTDNEFTTALTKIKSMGADAVYVAAINTSQGASIYRQLKQVGHRGAVIASAGNMNPKLVELSGASIEGVYSVSLFAPDSQRPMARKWMTQYAQMFKNEPSFIGALGAQSIELLAAAVNKAGDARNYAKIATVLRSQKWDTLLGDIGFDDKGQAAQAIYLVQVKDKKIIGVK